MHKCGIRTMNAKKRRFRKDGRRVVKNETTGDAKVKGAMRVESWAEVANDRIRNETMVGVVKRVAGILPRDTKTMTKGHKVGVDQKDALDNKRVMPGNIVMGATEHVTEQETVENETLKRTFEGVFVKDGVSLENSRQMQIKTR